MPTLRGSLGAAGLQVGDVITEVDGLSTVSMNQGEFAERMRRPVGTLVRLGTVRDGTLRAIVLTLKEMGARIFARTVAILLERRSKCGV